MGHPLSKKEVIQKIIETLTPLGVLRISIFGSFARNEETEESDVDILVLLPDIQGRKIIGLKWFSVDQELSEKIGRRVDLVTEGSLNETLRKIVSKDLKVIYEKAG